MKFFVYTMAGSAFLLVGILSLVLLTGHGHPTFDLIELARRAPQLTQTEQRLIFLALVAAFAVKTPLFPLHTWLPDAHTEAPTAGSIILAGVLLKLGAYGILRFAVFLLPKAAVDLAPLLLTLAVIGITYGAIVATMQKDLKRLIAYSSVAHLGFIVLGIFAFTSQGISGGVIQMVNHGLSTGALFFLVGMIYERRHTRQISELGGLQKSVPVLAAVFLFVAMSSIGLPGLNGFVGEFLIMIGTFLTHRWWAIVAATGVILAAVYMLWAYQRVFHGVALGRQRHHDRHDLARAGRHAAPHRRDHLSRRLPEAGPRPDQPVGQPSDRPRPARRSVLAHPDQGPRSGGRRRARRRG